MYTFIPNFLIIALISGVLASAAGLSIKMNAWMKDLCTAILAVSSTVTAFGALEFFSTIQPNSKFSIPLVILEMLLFNAIFAGGMLLMYRIKDKR